MKPQKIPNLPTHNPDDHLALCGTITHGLFQDNIANSPIRANLHRHDFHEIAIFSQGTGNYLADFTSHQVNTPSAVLIPSGTVHQWPEAQQLRGHIIAFDLEFLGTSGRAQGPSTILRPPIPTIIPLTPEQLSNLNSYADRIHTEYLSPCPYRRQIIRALLTIILIDLSRIHDSLTKPPQTSAEKLYSTFLDTLEKNWLTHNTPKKIANLLNVSPDHLAATLRSITHKNTSELITERIILEAKRHLAHSRLSISEIAYQCGFEDPSYFTRVFKKQTGTTPKQFREPFTED